jgi:hypothetical protein
MCFNQPQRLFQLTLVQGGLKQLLSLKSIFD